MEEFPTATTVLITRAKGIDHILHAQEAIMQGQMLPSEVFGDKSFLWHLNSGMAALEKSLEGLLLTPRARAQYLEDNPQRSTPLANILADVHQITTG